MNPDRKNGPAIKELQKLSFPNIDVYHLSNGLRVHEISSGTQAIIKLELVFRAGRPYERKKLVSKLCGQLLKEGTTTLDGKQVADQIEFFGATLNTSSSLDASSVVLYCLAKHFESLIPLFVQVAFCPSFTEEEIKNAIDQSKERLKGDLAKNDIIAYRTITEKIFGEEHPYGYNSSPAGFDNVQREDLLEHHARLFTINQAELIISGQVTDFIRNSLESHLGAIQKLGSTPKSIPKNKIFQPETILIPTNHSLQTAIRIGMRTFHQDHQDYPGLYFLSTILGGYFGSRLMTNLREDKAYTYNIYSSLDNMLYDGYFNISAEVNGDHLEETMIEIEKEIELLKTEKIDVQEIRMVRNYILGNFISLLDGPFNTSKVAKSLILTGKDWSYFERFIEDLKKLDAKSLHNLSLKYLNLNDMWKVLVGKV